MKRYYVFLLCLVIFILGITACGEKEDLTSGNGSEIATMASTIQNTVASDPVDILTDAGLSQELIDAYFMIPAYYDVEIQVEDYIKLIDLDDDSIEAYLYTFGANYSVDEYIQLIEKYKAEGLTESQIRGYRSFEDIYTLEEYIQIIKDMVNAKLTDDQINRYADFTDIKLESYINLCKTFEDAEDILFSFDMYSLSKYYSFEEYCSFVSELRAVTEEQSLIVLCSIGEEAFFVQKRISTYNEEEIYFAIMNRDAELTVSWNSDWRYYDIKDSIYEGFCVVPCGYSTYDGSTVLCDVINMEGRKLVTIESNGNCFELGKGYILCAGPANAGGASIVHTSGEYCEVNGFGIDITGHNTIETDAWIGQVGEGLWGTIVDRGNRGIYARYYNTNGEMIIDLRENLTNFAVTKLGEFSEGQARIEFIGANHKNYYVYIDKTGAFIGDPVEVAE